MRHHARSEFFIQLIFIVPLTLIAIGCLYPIVYVFSKSISEARRIAFETLWLFPKGFSLVGYGEIFNQPSIWKAYGNTLFYTFFGTLINVVLTTMLAYSLSRKDFTARNVLMFLVTFTMLFSGGLIPTFILVTKLQIYNTVWAMLLPEAIAVWNTIIARTFFVGLPDMLAESAKLDGANDLVILAKIIIPMSKAIIAVLIIFYAVGHWNSYLTALLYLPDSDLHPLQLFLAKLLVNDESMLEAGGEEALDITFVTDQLKYVAIMVAIIPILCIYPIFQKYFIKGVMVGAIKG